MGELPSVDNGKRQSFTYLFQPKQEIDNSIQRMSGDCVIESVSYKLTPVLKQRFCQKLRKNVNFRRKFIHTTFLWWTGMTLGWISGQVGPSLLDLQLITKTSFEEASRLLTAGSIGFLIGSMTGGFFFSRLSSHVLLFCSLLGGTVLTAIIPWCIVYEVMMAAMFIRHLCLGATDTVVNAELLSIWRLKNRSYMQALHFSFAVGAIMSPLATVPFLTPVPENTQNNTSSVISTALNLSVDSNSNMSDFEVPYLSHSYSKNMVHGVRKNYDISYVSSLPNIILNSSCCSNFTEPYFNNNYTTGGGTGRGNLTFSIASTVSNSDSRLYMAFSISAVLALSSCGIYFVLCCKKRRKSRANCKIQKENKTSDSESKSEGMPLLTKISVLCIMMFLIGLYNAVEESFSGFLTTFCVKHLKWSKSVGSIATSVFWATFGAGRFLGIFFIRMCSPYCMIDIYGAIAILSFTGLLLSSLGHTNVFIWICIILVGFSLSVLCPTIFTLTEEIIHVTGKVAAGLKISANVGSMVNSVILGLMIDRLSPLWFCYLLLGQCIFNFVLCVSTTFYSKHILRTYPNNVRRNISFNIKNDNSLITKL